MEMLAWPNIDRYEPQLERWVPALIRCLEWDEAARRALLAELGKPYSTAGFGNSFKDWCKEAGLPQSTCHGLRKISAVRAAEVCASEHELMATFGWENADMARVYTRKAAQKKLAASGVAKLTHSGTIVPPSVPPEEIINKIHLLIELAPRAGLEPATERLTAACSTN